MNLKDIFNKHNCDKASKHNYHLYYDKLFNQYSDPINVLEIGVYKGDSAVAFAEFKPSNTYYGVDIFDRVSIEDATSRVIEAGQDQKVNFFYCDSTDPKSVRKAMKSINTKFDIIIDDGAHWPKANMLTLRNFIPHLNKGGTYVIEDVWPLDKMSGNELKHYWLRKHPERYNNIDQAMFTQSIDEVSAKYKLDVKTHDYRKMSGFPDSYIISLFKK